MRPSSSATHARHAPRSSSTRIQAAQRSTNASCVSVGAVLAGAKLPSQLGQRARVGRRRGLISSSPCSMASRRNATPRRRPRPTIRGRRRTRAGARPPRPREAAATSCWNFSSVYHSSRAPWQTSAVRHAAERGGVELRRDVAADGDDAVDRRASRQAARNVIATPCENPANTSAGVRRPFARRPSSTTRRRRTRGCRRSRGRDPDASSSSRSPRCVRRW